MPQLEEDYPDPPELTLPHLLTYYATLQKTGLRIAKSNPDSAFVTGLWLGLLCREETPKFGYFTLQVFQLMLAKARKVPLEQIEKDGIEMMLKMRNF